MNRLKPFVDYEKWATRKSIENPIYAHIWMEECYSLLDIKAYTDTNYIVKDAERRILWMQDENRLFFNWLNMGFLKLDLENDMKIYYILFWLLFWWAFLSIYYQMHFCWENILKL